MRYVLLIICLMAVACSRKAPNSSALKFRTPSHPNVSEKSTNTAFNSALDNFCYYVNVTGSGIAQIPRTCAPIEGLNSGFVPPLSVVELTVPKGDGRTVELFGFIPEANQSCSSLPADLGAVPVNRLFKMGKMTNVNMSGDETVIELKIAFPGTANHYGIQSGLASSCYAGLPPITAPGNVSSPVQVGTQYKVLSKVSSGVGPSQAAAGSTYKVIGGITHVAQ